MTQWWFDVKQGRAVSDEERGPDRDVLGPYPTKEAAEDWRSGHDARNEAWDEDDREDGDDDRSE